MYSGPTTTSTVPATFYTRPTARAKFLFFDQQENDFEEMKKNWIYIFVILTLNFLML